MKIKLYIAAIGLLSMGLSSCNAWLDVKPQTEVTVDDMFSKQQGYQDVLIGCYLKLKNQSVYGGNLLYGPIEYLAQHWNYTSESTQEKISRYNYIDESVQNTFSSIYGGLYAVIAETNGLLAEMEERKEFFEPGIYEIIKGEALAMRAFCHLDVLRLFGPMPSKVGGDVILPYVRTVSLNYHEHYTYQEFTSFLEEDLLMADSLLKGSDPIITRIGDEGENTVSELSISAQDFLVNRNLRFNYYAVKALEARFYLWLGDEEHKAKAYACAKEVIDAKNEEGNALFSLGSLTDLGNEDYSFSKEHVMAIYDFNLYTKAEENFTVSAPYAKDKSKVQSIDFYSPGTTDIRWALWTEFTNSDGSKSHTIKKYWQKDEESAINQLPLLRLAEMYLIAMECGSLADADALYDTFCISRDLPKQTISSSNQLVSILEDEYNKEFYGEGQAFYAFKRLAVEDILWALDPGNEESYVVPLPLDEINYRKK